MELPPITRVAHRDTLAVMRFLVLGPLEVMGEDGEPSRISGSKERLVLAYLIARAGYVVSVDDLVDELWGERPPRTGEKTLGSYVSRLRGALDPGHAPGSTSEVIASRGGGYVLEVDGHEIDAVRFERLAAESRRLIDTARMADATAVLDEALGLWRGNAFQEFRYTSFGSSEGERLAELRRAAIEDLIDTRLAAGDAGTLIADLEAMVREEPLRERRWGQLMLALHRAGRQAEALQAFSRARTILVDEVGIEPGIELQRLQTAILAQDPKLERRSTPGEPVRSTDLCPYKGLARFDTTDAEFFFGREQMIADGVGRLVGGRFLAFVGASGSGKSSVMRAGLLHALASGALPGSDRWAYALMRPGEHPLNALHRAIDGAHDATRSVLAVDQFEETFTACADDAERTAFLDALTDAALSPDGTVTILLAVRADYYGRCAEHRDLATLLSSSQILVGPMNEDELRRAIELPAERADLIVEQELTDALVRDSAGQPGGLPLLSTALLELWTRRRDRTLGVDDYLGIGGVEGAVARLAEDAFARLDVEGQTSAKRILLRLALSGEGKDVVRRRASLAEFDLERDASASRALAVLTDARLVTVAEGTAEVAHEALLRDWPRLRTWLEDDAEGRNLHRHVSDSAFAWEEGGRDDGDLYRGARLTAAMDWAEAHESDPNDLESAFLQRSRSASEGQAVRARRTNRLLRGLLAGVAVLLALSLVIGSLALRQRDQAQAVATVADARQLAASSLTQEDLIVSLLLAREAVALDDSPQTRSALLSALQRDPAAIAAMHADGAPPGDLTEWLQLSPDGRILATGGARTTVVFFDANSYQRLGDVDVRSETTTGDFSADGGTLVVAAVDQRLVSIDVDTRTVRTSVATAGREVDAVLFGPEGDRLLTGESIQEQGFLVPRDPVTLEPSGAEVPLENGPIASMASSLDGRRLVTTGIPPDARRPGGHTALWKWTTRDLEQVGDAFPIGGNDVALSPDGWTAAIAASLSGNNNTDELKGHLVLLDLRTGEWQRSVEGSTPGVGGGFGLTGVMFSSDGSVISTGDDHRVLFWDASSTLPTIEEAFDDPAGLEVFSPVLSPDGATLFTIDVDGNLVAWDMKGDRRIGRSFTVGSDATYLNGSWFVISPDGRTLAVLQVSPHGHNGWVRLVDASTLEEIGEIPLDGKVPQGLAFSPDGRTLAVCSYGYVQLWDVQTRTPEGPPFRVPGNDLLWAAAFSPDGSVLATAGSTVSDAGVVFLWNVSTGQLAGRLPKLDDLVSTLNFSPDGMLLVVSMGYGKSGDVIVWNVAQSQPERTIPADDSGVLSADLSNDGTTLVTGGDSGRERLWDLSTGDPVGPAFDGPTSTVDLSPDGRTVAAAGGHGQVVMWDVATRTVLGRSFTPVVGPRDNLTAAFTPDGARLFILSETGEGWVWNVDPSSWESRACQIAGRSMTQAEWSLYLPDRPYQATCGS
jgi:WD40 repeat protein/DNA-binding SARP family transcriptional activator